MKNIKYLIEYIFLKLFLFLFGCLKLDTASWLGGRIACLIGPLLSQSRIADKNLKAIMPDISEKERKNIIRGMWDNIGRIFGEYPHMEQIGAERIEIVGHDILEKLIASEKGSIVFGAHMANWEMTSYALHELSPSPVIRVPNNPFTRELIGKRRGAEIIPKSAAGTRKLVRFLKEGRHVGILIDQKYNEGISTPFLGKPAMTSPAFIQLGRKFSCPLAPIRFERINGANFRITLHEPLNLYDKSAKPLSDEECIAKAHAYIESWIKERPEQWIWIHRRWKL